MTGLVAGGLFNAIAFAGAGFIFSKLNHTGYETEIKRHNKAMESLARAKETFYENEIRQRDKIQELRQQLSDANADINDTNHALDQLRQVLTIQYDGKTFSKEPELSDYYKPSDEMKKYQKIFVGAVGLPLGYVVYRIV